MIMGNVQTDKNPTKEHKQSKALIDLQHTEKILHPKRALADPLTKRVLIK